MNAGLETANKACRHITHYLYSQKSTLNVINVENDAAFQKEDVDLIWQVTEDGSKKDYKIEIKGDNYFHTDNYFLEIKSNVQKNTPGCFLYSSADFFYYYFIGKELHIIPLPAAKQWFLTRAFEFKTKLTSTPAGNFFYNTEGALVPRRVLQRHVPVQIIPYEEAWNEIDPSPRRK